MRRCPPRARLAWTFLLALATALPPAAAAQQVSQLAAFHRAGQTWLTWREVDSPLEKDQVPARELRSLRRKLEAEGKVRYRVYRSSRPIDSLDGLEPVAEVPPLSCWNADYHGNAPRIPYRTDE